MNNKNLKPISSEKEAREKGKRGGKKSGEVRKKRKALKEELLLLLETNDYNKKISTALINKALEGNTKAFEVIRDTIGEKPNDNETNLEPPVIIDFSNTPTEELRKLVNGDIDI